MPDEPIAPPPDTMRPIDRLLEAVRRLLGPGGCPWDRAQTHATLKPYLIEECHELLDAIDRGDPNAIREELGDMLLQVALHSEMERAAGRFDFDAVAAGIADKVIRRHAHVFGGAEPARCSAEALALWDRKKRAERGGGSLLDGIPTSLPSLLHASKLSARAAGAGFDWPDTASVRAKLDEEVRELDAAAASGDSAAVRHEIGDVLFAAANLARRLGHDAEESLRECAARFRERFAAMEAEAVASGRPIGAAGDPAAPSRSLEELEEMWQRAKERLGRK